jgi:hypothetical protein
MTPFTSACAGHHHSNINAIFQVQLSFRSRIVAIGLGWNAFRETHVIRHFPGSPETVAGSLQNLRIRWNEEPNRHGSVFGDPFTGPYGSMVSAEQLTRIPNLGIFSRPHRTDLRSEFETNLPATVQTGRDRPKPAINVSLVDRVCLQRRFCFRHFPSNQNDISG